MAACCLLFGPRRACMLPDETALSCPVQARPEGSHPVTVKKAPFHPARPWTAAFAPARIIISKANEETDCWGAIPDPSPAAVLSWTTQTLSGSYFRCRRPYLSSTTSHPSLPAPPPLTSPRQASPHPSFASHLPS